MKEEKIVMKTQLIKVFFLIVGGLFMMPGLAMAQPEQTAVGTPPLEQPLIREGDLAVKLAEALKLGTPESETEAESTLASVYITPRNGWIADYPVTPDIVNELQAAVDEAAEAGKINLNKEAALKTFQDVMNEYDLSVKADTSGKAAGETTGPNYPDSAAEDNYYYDEGPPVVTYYTPPPDYVYLYTWVPYPFWWSDVWFPGFFILETLMFKQTGTGTVMTMTITIRKSSAIISLIPKQAECLASTRRIEFMAQRFLSWETQDGPARQ